MALYKRHQTLAEVTNGTDETYYYPLMLESFRGAVIQCILSGGSGSVTVTIEATTDPAIPTDSNWSNLDWSDITSEYFSVSNITASGNFVMDDPFPWRAIRVKVVASTGGANNADWTIHAGVQN